MRRTSIQDILNDLGLSKGGLYHHFKSKEAILDRLNADEWAVTARLLDKLIERKDMSALEKLRVLIVSAVDAPDHLDLVRSQLALLKDPAFFTANMRFWSTRLPESFRSLIDMGVQDGSIPTAYPEEAAQLLSLLGNYWLMPCFYPRPIMPTWNTRIRCLATHARRHRRASVRRDAHPADDRRSHGPDAGREYSVRIGDAPGRAASCTS